MRSPASDATTSTTTGTAGTPRPRAPSRSRRTSRWWWRCTASCVHATCRVPAQQRPRREPRRPPSRPPRQHGRLLGAALRAHLDQPLDDPRAGRGLRLLARRPLVRHEARPVRADPPRGRVPADPSAGRLRRARRRYFGLPLVAPDRPGAPAARPRADEAALAGPLLYGAPIIERSGISLAEQAALTLSALRSPRGAAASALRGIFQSHTTWLAADAARHEIRERWARFYEDFDVLLLPVTPTAAPPHHGDDLNRDARHIDVDGGRRSYWDQMSWNAVANVAGTPATTIPVTSTASGLPVGVQAMGAAGDDLTTIEFAALLGAELQGYRIPPGAGTSSALTG
ncbi:amidase family protein [Actinomycetospora sp. CA-101289]|uniref:amidase family protein n=1 Tax=Actinomycetospora sp. CA-101289 TaxID=3239893 RepID=UPI003D9952F2